MQLHFGNSEPNLLLSCHDGFKKIKLYVKYEKVMIEVKQCIQNKIIISGLYCSVKGKSVAKVIYSCSM